MNSAPQENEQPQAPTGFKLRVLVVDDQESVLEVVSETISYAGHEVVGRARDGMEAVKLAQDLKPDLVVMDVLMPKLNGVEAMRSILAGGLCKRVMLMSGECRSLGMTREQILQKGALTFLEKPFNVTELFSLLDQWASDVAKEKAR